MNFFSWLWGRRSREQRFNLRDPEALDIFGAQPTASGVKITESSALRYSAVLACVRLLAETVASLPLHVYQRRPDGGKRRATEHPLYRVLHTAPNDEMTSFRWRSAAQGHLSAWGNSYNYLVWSGDGQLTSIWPLSPQKMRLAREKSRLVYFYREEEIPAGEILHIPGFGFDGVSGRSLLRLAREAVALGLAAEEFGARFFGSGTHPGVVVEHPGKLSPEAHKNLKESLSKAHSGLGKSHKLLLLEEGMTVESLGIPPEDAQFLETRKFQVNEICRIFRVPPHMIADLDNATFTNIEHQSIDFVVHTIRPWLVLWEQELERVLLSRADQAAGYFIRHNVDGLLRGDIKSRYEAYAVGRQNGWLSANDIRDLEDLNPIPSGDIYLVPLNMVPADELGGATATPPDAEAKAASRERRQKRQAAARGLLRQQYHGLFFDAAARTLGREITALRRALKKHLRASGDFNRWLDEFYGDLPETIRRDFARVLQSYTEAVSRQAADEIGAKWEMTPALERFINDYLEGYSSRHVNSSLGQIRALLRDADDPAAAIEERLDEWGETRAGKIAANETVRGDNAVARFVFAAAGIQYLRWIAQGDKSCPYCQELDGKVVGINSFYVHEGEEFEPEGADGRFKVTGPKAHPPLHQGCVCTIVAET